MHFVKNVFADINHLRNIPCPEVQVTGLSARACISGHSFEACVITSPSSLGFLWQQGEDLLTKGHFDLLVWHTKCLCGHGSSAWKIRIYNGQFPELRHRNPCTGSLSPSQGFVKEQHDEKTSLPTAWTIV